VYVWLCGVEREGETRREKERKGERRREHGEIVEQIYSTELDASCLKFVTF
jgi:hypothetical protein